MKISIFFYKRTRNIQAAIQTAFVTSLQKMPSTHIPESTAEEQTDNWKPINLDLLRTCHAKDELLRICHAKDESGLLRICHGKMNLDCFESVCHGMECRKGKELAEIYVEDRSSPLTCRQKNGCIKNVHNQSKSKKVSNIS